MRAFAEADFILLLTVSPMSVTRVLLMPCGDARPGKHSRRHHLLLFFLLPYLIVAPTPIKELAAAFPQRVVVAIAFDEQYCVATDRAGCAHEEFMQHARAL